MGRQIFAEEPQQEEQDEQQVTPTESSVSDSVTTTNTSAIDGESTIITAREMKKLFNEWDANGKNDLCINPTLAERIQKYLEYQEQLDPLKAKLAERIYKPYLIAVSSEPDHRDFSLYVNEYFVLKAPFYLFDNLYQLVNIITFKRFLSHIGNPYALYMDASKKLYIDIHAYVIANGGSLSFNEGYHITL